MSQSENYSFTRYLEAKKSVDDRALNRHVWERFAASTSSWNDKTPLRLLEIGAGIGTMVERLEEWGALPAHCEITVIDEQQENIAEASKRLGAFTRFPVNLICDDLFEFASRQQKHQWDAVVAHAVLDLFDIPEALDIIFSLFKPGGPYLFTINFDGVTLLEPEIDPQFDRDILQLYHKTMDERITGDKPSGDSRAGRHLFNQLKMAGAEIAAAGSSDWVVFPSRGGYPGDEAYFLHFIVNTIHRALKESDELDQDRFERWIALRHHQIERAEFVYIAHQIDFTGFGPRG